MAIAINKTAGIATVVVALSGIAAGSALAQTAGSTGSAGFQSGYGNARYSVTQNQTGSTRDANGNRLIVDGIIQAGASSYNSRTSGVSSSYSGIGSTNGNGLNIGGATATGNSLNVVVQGNRNTVIVNSRQINNGNITAGTVLNGTLDLND